MAGKTLLESLRTIQIHEKSQKRHLFQLFFCDFCTFLKIRFPFFPTMLNSTSKRCETAQAAHDPKNWNLCFYAVDSFHKTSLQSYDRATRFTQNWSFPPQMTLGTELPPTETLLEFITSTRPLPQYLLLQPFFPWSQISTTPHSWDITAKSHVYSFNLAITTIGNFIALTTATYSRDSKSFVRSEIKYFIFCNKTSIY